jgi:DHA1 family bicyclomycin/chloramphenicol resistance-like MFS transporter
MSEKRNYLFIALILGLLTMTGPISIDVFVPIIPKIAVDLQVNVGFIELSLTAIFAGNGLGQIIYGTISDKFGRKPVILTTLFIFLLTTIGAGLSSNIETLIFWRFFQGLLMASGRILANAVARDLFEQEKLRKLITLVMAVGILSSLFSAPVGGYLAENCAWQTVFWFMSIYAMITFLVFLFFFKETIVKKDDDALNGSALFSNFSKIIINKIFILNVICGGFILSGLVAFLNSSSGVLINTFGVKPSVYGWIFSLVMLGYALSALAQQKLIDRIKPKKLMLISGFLSAFSGLLMFALILINISHPIIIIVPMLIFMMGFASLWPQSVAACLQPFPDKAGAASSLQGFIQNSMAAVVSAFLSIFSDGTAIPMGAAIAMCGVLTAITAIVLTRKESSL